MESNNNLKSKSEVIKENEQLKKQLESLKVRAYGISENATTTRDIHVRDQVPVPGSSEEESKEEETEEKTEGEAG